MNMTPPVNAVPCLLRLPEVLARVGVSRTTLYRWIQDGQFPQSHALTPTRSTVAWSAAAVSDWIAAKLAGNDSNSDSNSVPQALQPA